MTDVSSDMPNQGNEDADYSASSRTPFPTERSSRRRTPQAQRSAQTRRKLILAAIDSLHAVGYSFTTVSMVADKAGVSRGALTHQFPSKIDLMLAVVQFVYESDAAQYKVLLGDKPPAESLAFLPEAMWEVLSQPSAIAVIEIMLASRADLALMNQLRIMQSQIDVDAGRAMIGRFKEAGIDDRPDGAAIHRMFVSAVRGLAIENLSMGRPADIAKSIKILSEVVTLLYPQLSKPSQTPARPKTPHKRA